MSGAYARTAVLVVWALAAAGCASSPDEYSGALPSESADSARIETPSTPLECVPYARTRSGVVIYGDAGTWWAKAEGRYVRGTTPILGSVMVLTGYAGPGRGHVAVVSGLVSGREIILDHANWLGDGAIYRHDPAVDVSPENDWSEVRVWNARVHSWGVRTYLVQGFIGPEPDTGSARVAGN
jgi:surface antigen